jgi:hypothetical protein
LAVTEVLSVLSYLDRLLDFSGAVVVRGGPRAWTYLRRGET